MKAYLILYSFLFLVSNAFSQETNFKTIEYFKNDTLSLALDYFSPNNERGNPTPLFIFVHGGGFSGGSRESGHEICKFLSENGIASASISYTLYMKGKSFSCDGILSEKMKAIQLASNQFLLATQYFIDNADEFNIIKNKIYAAGSSAGAETVLQAVYGNRSLAKYFKLTLPTNFRYAGLISGAGAIADINNVNPSTQIPALFFHGTCDKLVPYATAPHHY